MLVDFWRISRGNDLGEMKEKRSSKHFLKSNLHRLENLELKQMEQKQIKKGRFRLNYLSFILYLVLVAFICFGIVVRNEKLRLFDIS